MSKETDDTVKLLQTIGLSEQKAKETAKNVQVTKNLKAAIDEVGYVVHCYTFSLCDLFESRKTRMQQTL